MCAAVLLPARLIMVGAERMLLAPAHRSQPIGSHAERNQKLACRIGAPLAQSEVVLERAALVTVSLDRHPDLGVRAQEFRIPRQGLPGVRAQIGTVEIEKGITNVLCKQLLERRTRSQLRSGRRTDGNAHTVGGIAPRPGG